MQISKVIATAVVLTMAAVVSSIGVINPEFFLKGVAYADQMDSKDSGDEEELRRERKWLVFVRRARYVIDLMRLQKSVFLDKHGNIRNEITFRVEELINDANWDASQDMFDEGYGKLDTAEANLKESLGTMGVAVKAGKSLPSYTPTGFSKRE